MTRDDWKEQYKHMKRWRDRLNDPSSFQMESDPHLFRDSLFAFFISCFHLGDWLQFCGLENAMKHAKDDEYLGICRGIADGSKHFKLTKKHSSEFFRTNIGTLEGPYFGSTTGASTFDLNSIPCPESILPVKNGECFVTIENKDPINMLDLADSCIASWDKYIKENGLNPPCS